MGTISFWCILWKAVSLEHLERSVLSILKTSWRKKQGIIIVRSLPNIKISDQLDISFSPFTLQEFNCSCHLDVFMEGQINCSFLIKSEICKIKFIRKTVPNELKSCVLRFKKWLPKFSSIFWQIYDVIRHKNGVIAKKYTKRLGAHRRKIFKCPFWLF